MKVVDGKGKLFGKINIIDLLVIILIIAVIAALGLKVLGVGGIEEPATTKLTYTVRVTAQKEAVAEYITQYVDASAGKRDQLMAGGNLVNGYVVDFWTEPTHYNRTEVGDVMPLDPDAAAAAGLVDLCFTVEAYVTNTVSNEVGNQDVRAGIAHVLKTAHMEFVTGSVETCRWEPVEG